MLKKAKRWIAEYRLTIIFAVTGLLVFSFLYLYRLGGFVSGNSVYESKLFLGINTSIDVLQEAAFLPLRSVQFLMLKIDDPNVTLLRLLSVAVLLLSFVVFYSLIAKWHTHRIAILATILFAATSYSLHLGRFTHLDSVYYLVIPSLLLFGTWLKSKKNVTKLPLILPIVALMLYIPGFIYFILPLPFIFRKRLILAWRFVDGRQKIISVIISGLLLLPLVYAFVSQPTQFKRFFAIDVLFNSQPFETIGQRFIDIFDGFLYQGINEPHRWLVGTPILDIGTLALVILGIYAYIKGPHTLRARLLLLFTGISIVVFTFGNLITLSVLLPVIYIFVAAGLVYLLESWFTVFPRNPAARNIAIALIIVLVATITSYHLQRYFIAWPNTPEVKAALQKTEL